MDSIPLSYHAFPDVVPNPQLSSLTEEELLAYIDGHQNSIVRDRERISWHEKAIAQYNVCLNAIRPLINIRLPQELLGEIFTQYRDMSWLGWRRYEWLQVAHVCRYWRSIALSYPSLFAYFSLYKPLEMVTEWLVHSGSVPIDLTGILTRENSVWDAVIPHLSRTVQVQIELPDASDGCKISWPDCPLMQTISCRPAVMKAVERYTILYEVNPQLLEELLECTPNLQKFAILIPYSGCRLQWNPCPMPPNLRRMTITGWAVDETVTLVSVLQALPHLTELRLLRLHRVFFPVSRKITTPSSPLVHPSLQLLRLAIGGMPTPLAALSKSVVCQHSFHLSMQLYEDRRHSRSSKDLSRILSTYYCSPLLFATLYIDVGEGRYYNNNDDCEGVVIFNGWKSSSEIPPSKATSYCLQVSSTFNDDSLDDDSWNGQWPIQAFFSTLCPCLNHLEHLRITTRGMSETVSAMYTMILNEHCLQWEGLRSLYLELDKSSLMRKVIRRFDPGFFPNLTFLSIYCRKSSDCAGLAEKLKSRRRRLEVLKLKFKYFPDSRENPDVDLDEFRSLVDKLVICASD